MSQSMRVEDFNCGLIIISRENGDIIFSNKKFREGLGWPDKPRPMQFTELLSSIENEISNEQILNKIFETKVSNSADAFLNVCLCNYDQNGTVQVSLKIADISATSSEDPSNDLRCIYVDFNNRITRSADARVGQSLQLYWLAFAHFMYICFQAIKFPQFHSKSTTKSKEGANKSGSQRPENLHLEDSKILQANELSTHSTSMERVIPQALIGSRRHRVIPTEENMERAQCQMNVDITPVESDKLFFDTIVAVHSKKNFQDCFGRFLMFSWNPCHHLIIYEHVSPIAP